jgi:hypothetical protein
MRICPPAFTFCSHGRRALRECNRDARLRTEIDHVGRGRGHSLWIENARHSNRCAKLLAQKLSAVLGSQPIFPCEANAVFFRLAEALVTRVQERGWHFYKFIEPDVYRFMCSWSTSETLIDEFVADMRNSLAAPEMAHTGTG